MLSTQEFIYKGYRDGFSKHERAVHMLRRNNAKDLYYLFQLDREIEAGQKVLINYNHTMPYKKGQLLVGGSL